MQTGRNLRTMLQSLARSLRCAACLNLSKQMVAMKTFESPMERNCLHLQAGNARHTRHSVPQASTARPGWGRGDAPHRPPPTSWRSARPEAEARRSTPECADWSQFEDDAPKLGAEPQVWGWLAPTQSKR